MKTSLKLPVAALIFALGVFASSATTLTLNPFMDAMVTTGPSGNLVNSSYGGAGALALSATGLSKGEFQSVMQFNPATVKSTLDGLYGVGSWTLQSVTLQLTAAANNNAIFNNNTAGQFSISLMQNNSWTEGNGSPMTPSATGINYSTLQSTYINNGTDEALGTFSYAGGSSGANIYTLTLSPTLVSDLFAGTDMSFRLYAADSSVSYIFNSKDFGTAGNRPVLTVTAVPEPTTLATVALGTILFSSWRLKSRRHRA